MDAQFLLDRWRRGRSWLTVDLTGSLLLVPCTSPADELGKGSRPARRLLD